MIPHTYSDEGIILARRNYGEADRIIPIYSKSYGKITFIAKGIRRPESKKRGHLEIFTCVRFSAAKGKSMDILTEVETLNSFELVRNDLKKVSLAYYFMEVIGKITHDGEPHSEIYYLLVKYLNRLETEPKLKSLRMNFISELLVNLGFWPRGKIITDPDKLLEEVLERKLYSVRVGKEIIQ
jgi:DNA repair protein RecO (recombination protein O)